MSQTRDHSYKIFTIEGLESEKENALINLTKQQVDDDYSIIVKIFLCIKILYEAIILLKNAKK